MTEEYSPSGKTLAQHMTGIMLLLALHGKTIDFVFPYAGPDENPESEQWHIQITGSGCFRRFGVGSAHPTRQPINKADADNYLLSASTVLVYTTSYEDGTEVSNQDFQFYHYPEKFLGV